MNETPARGRRQIVVTQAAVAVTPAPVIKIELAEAVFGLTRKAVEGKIARGDWLQGRQYHRAPDGIWIDVAGVQRWVITGKA